MRLIDADALFETLVTGDIRETHQFCYPCKKVLEAIDAQPTVELQRMKGRWIGYAGTIGAECSECHKWLDVIQGTAEMNYCPNCGAELRGDEGAAD